MLLAFNDALFVEQRYKIALAVRYQHLQPDKSGPKRLLYRREEIIETPLLLRRYGHEPRPKPQVGDDAGAYRVRIELAVRRADRSMSVVHKVGEEAVDLVAQTKIFQLAESLGGVESLIEHPARMTHASTADAPFAAPRNLIRLSVGLESAEDLVADLGAALVRSTASAGA